MTPYERICDAAEAEGRRLYSDYSGRGMFGATCVGIVCDDPTDVIAEVGLRGARMDNMGLSSIVYWPSVQGPDVEGDDDSAAREAEDRLQRAIAEDDDMTGQDNEERINDCARDLIAARDRSLRARDPDAYEERRQMGLL